MMRFRKHVSILTAAVAGLAFTSFASALDLTVISTRAEWENRFVTFQTENFNSLPDETVAIGDPAGGTLTGPNGFDITIDRGSPLLETGIINGLYFGDVHSPTDLNGDPQTDVPQVTTFTFDGEIFGFAANILSNNTAGLEIMIADQTIEVPVGSSSFFGVISKLPFGFDEVQIKYLGDPGSPRNLSEQFILDDISFSDDPIPEPLTGGLALIGMGALTLTASRRRRA